MKVYKLLGCAIMFAIAFLSNGCKKLLEEHPQSGIVPSLFNTTPGVLGGIAGVYNDIRSQWGTEGFSAEMVAGTDEHLAGASASGIHLYTYNGITGSNFGSAWGAAFTDINTLNGVLQYAPTFDSVTLAPATKQLYIAHAKFLRAFWYFYLVQTFGDVPLHTQFITVPSQAASRQPVAQVYEQIIKDLTEAAADLPNTPTAPFLGKAATKPVAQYLLAKAYLTRGWLNNTQSDFVQAYTIASDIIANKASYNLDLWQDYGDAFNPANDYGKETLFVSEHSSDPRYGQYMPGASGGAAQNLTPWFYIWNYPSNSGVNSFKNAAGALVNAGTSTMVRDVPNGRPYIRTRPNTDVAPTGKRYILDQAFADRTNDSRYANTFQTIWKSNVAVTNDATAANNVRGISYSMTPGVDTAIWMPDFEVEGAPQFEGTRPFKGIIIPPSLWNNSYFPVVKKFMDPSRTGVNDPSTRPVVIYRFSDVYLIAAEAAFKAGDLSNAAAMINVVRQRAAYRRTNTPAQNEAAATAMTITPDQVTLDFILDERSREFFGEWQRWHDLVRTRALVARVKAWNNEAAPNIKEAHMLRPIPQSQIDRTVEGPPFPQNAEY